MKLRLLLFLLLLLSLSGVLPIPIAFAQKTARGKKASAPHVQLVPYRVGAKWGFSDTAGTLIIPPKHENIEALQNGMFMVRKGKRWGLANAAGKIIYRPKFHLIVPLTSVKDVFYVHRGNRRGFIDATGHVIVPARFKVAEHLSGNLYAAGSLSYNNIGRAETLLAIYGRNGRITPPEYKETYVYPSGYVRLTKGENKVGLMAPDGKIIVPLKYKFVSDVNEGWLFVTFGQGQEQRCQYLDEQGNVALERLFHKAQPFTEGLAAVTYDGIRYGFIDKKEKAKTKFTYTMATPFRNGYAIVQQDGKYGIIDRNDSIVEPFIYTELKWQRSIDVIEGRTEESHKRNLNLSGYFGPRGRTSLGRYNAIRSFYEGMAEVITLEGKHGFINTKGQEVVPAVYDKVNTFSEGLAAVEKEGLWGYVDSTGNIVIPLQYGGALANYDTYYFHDGIAPVMIDEKYKPGYSPRWTYIDKTGRAITESFYLSQMRPMQFTQDHAAIPVMWKEIRPEYFAEPQLAVINKLGKRISNELFSHVGHTEQGLIYVCQTSGCGFIDTTGKVVIPLHYRFDVTSLNKKETYFFRGLLKAIDPKEQSPYPDLRLRSAVGYFSKTGNKYWKD